MASAAQPLDRRNPIINPDGTPSEFFIRWAQQFGQSTLPVDGISAGPGIAVGQGPVISLDAGLGDLKDVDLATTPPTDSQVIAFDEASGLWLPADQSGGGGGGGGQVAPIATYDLSGVSFFDIEGFSGRGFAEVEILIDIVASTDAVRPSLLFKLNGAYTVDSNYRYRVNSVASSGTGGNANSQTGASIPLVSTPSNFDIGNDPGNHCTINIALPSPDSATTWKMCRWFSETRGNTNSFIPAYGQALFDGPDATFPLEGVRLSISAGTMSGKIYVFAKKGTPGGGGGGGGGNWWFDPPAASSFSLMNNAATDLTLTDDPDAGLLIDPGAVANPAHRIAYRTLTNPTLAWDLKVFMPFWYPNQNYSAVGILVHNSTNSRSLRLDSQNNEPLAVHRYSSLTSWSSSLYANNLGPVNPWFRIAFDGTTYTFYHSVDGKLWTLLASDPAASFLNSGGGSGNRVGIVAYYGRTTGPRTVLSCQRFDLTGPGV